MKTPKLSEAQRRVMKWLGYGWTTEPGAGSSILANGQRICNVDTLMSLQRMGLVEQLEGAGPNGKLVGQWKATKEGCAVTIQLGL